MSHGKRVLSPQTVAWPFTGGRINAQAEEARERPDPHKHGYTPPFHTHLQGTAAFHPRVSLICPRYQAGVLSLLILRADLFATEVMISGITLKTHGGL